jgi:hypothetical protein
MSITRKWQQQRAYTSALQMAAVVEIPKPETDVDLVFQKL